MMPRKHGPWTINASTVKYQHELIAINEDQVTRPDGTPGIYAMAKVKPGAAVLAVDDEGFAYLAKEFRYAVGRETFEVVGGAIDEGEEPEAAARRELREELGIEASELVALGRVDPMTSLIDSPSHLFLARRLRFVEQQQEGSERIERIKVSLPRAVQMVYDSEITHGASGVLIMRAQKFLQDESEAGSDA